MTYRVLLHVQHLLGVGHDRRAAALARAFIAEGFAVTVARGGHPVSGTDFGAAEVVQLPPARAADAAFKALLDENGEPIDDSWRARRRDMVSALYQQVRPDALVVESFPFARRAFRFELIPLLEAARADGVFAVSSVRDVLVNKPDPARVREVVAAAKALFDVIFVHGDPALIPLEATFPAAAELKDLVVYTGYVAPPPRASLEPPGADGEDEVIVSVGGGAVGLPLLRAALLARRMTPAAMLTWRLLAGPDVGEADFNALRAKAPAGVIVERARPDFPGLLRRCRLSISQAGYNTTLDLLNAGCPAIVVPFAAAGETEQALRAQALAARGLLSVVDEARLTPESLAAAVNAVWTKQLPPPLALRTDGAAQSARLLRGWLDDGQDHDGA